MSQKLIVKNRSGKDVAFHLITPDGLRPQYVAFDEKNGQKQTRLEIDLDYAKKSKFVITSGPVDVTLVTIGQKKGIFGKEKDKEHRQTLALQKTFVLDDNIDRIIFGFKTKEARELKKSGKTSSLTDLKAK